MILINGTNIMFNWFIRIKYTVYIKRGAGGMWRWTAYDMDDTYICHRSEGDLEPEEAEARAKKVFGRKAKYIIERSNI